MRSFTAKHQGPQHYKIVRNTKFTLLRMFYVAASVNRKCPSDKSIHSICLSACSSDETKCSADF